MLKLGREVQSPTAWRCDDALRCGRQLDGDGVKAHRMIAVSRGVTSGILEVSMLASQSRRRLTLEVSRDVVFRLDRGSIDRIDCR